MHDFANALRIEDAEFAINRNASCDVNRSQRRIGHVFFYLFRIGLDVREIGWLIRKRNDLKFVGWALQTQFVSAAARLQFPTPKRDKARSCDHPRRVILDDVVSTTTGYEPPDNYVPSGLSCITCGNLENKQARFAEASLATHWITVRMSYSQIERCFEPVLKISNRRSAGAVLVPHR